MLENTYYIIIILGAIIGTAVSTITILFSLQQSFRKHLDELFITYDKNLKLWIREALEGYYIPLDERLKIHNLRLKKLEEKK